MQQDRMDKSAVGHDYVGKTEKHVSQKDYAQGNTPFGHKLENYQIFMSTL